MNENGVVGVSESVGELGGTNRTDPLTESVDSDGCVKLAHNHTFINELTLSQVCHISAHQKCGR
jgi:hypothetical protein